MPEVETIKLGLQKYLVGHKILDVEILSPKNFQGDKKNVIGAKVVEIDRAGKGLIIELSNGYALAIHLKLTGQIIYQGKETKSVHLSPKTGGALPSKYTRVIFKLKAQSLKRKAIYQNLKLRTRKEEYDYLYFNDLRKFGWVKVVKKEEVQNLPFFKEMGPEPDVIVRSKIKNQRSKMKAALTLERFREIVAKTTTPIKIILMDQKRIGGVGNIYANEALFSAGIDPRRASKSLNEKKTETLYKALLEVLKKGLKYGGSSDVNFVNSLGEEGTAQDHLLIYGRKGKKCFGCEGLIKKIELRGRGTYFCPNCQK